MREIHYLLPGIEAELLGDGKHIATNIVKHNRGYSFSTENENDSLFSTNFFFTQVVPYFLPTNVAEELFRFYSTNHGKLLYYLKNINELWEHN